MKKRFFSSVRAHALQALQGRLNFCTWYTYCILYTNIKYGQKFNPYFGLNHRFWLTEMVFSAKLRQHKLVTLNYLLPKFKENLYKFLRIIKERHCHEFSHPHSTTSIAHWVWPLPHEWEVTDSNLGCVIPIGEFHNVFKFHVYSVNNRFFLMTVQLARGLPDLATTNVCTVNTSNRHNVEISRWM